MSGHKWWGLAALMPALAMAFVDASVLPVALPTIQGELGASNVAAQWTVNSYLLAEAVLVLAGGRLGDRIGHRRAFSLGMLGFVLFSILCATSTTVGRLIAARFLQGGAAALMFPSSTALLMSLFPQSQRGKATGILVSSSALFLILGPLVGGYLTETVSWRWIFWINVPLAGLGFLMVFRYIPRSQPGTARLDLWGFLAFTAASCFLIIMIMEGRVWGWFSLPMLLMLLLFLVSAGLLLWREKCSQHPFLDLSLFRHPIFKAVNISISATEFILMISVFRAVYLQQVLGWTPITVGVVMLLSTLPLLFMSTIAGMVADRYGPKLPLAVGFCLIIFSFFWLAFYSQASLSVLFPGLLAFGTGIPLVLTPSYSSAMGSIPPTKAGTAFGTIASLRCLAASLGVAIIGTFIDTVQYRSLFSAAQQNPATESLPPDLLQDFNAGFPAALQAVEQLPTASTIVSYMTQAQVAGFHYSHLALGFGVIIAFGCVFVLYHRKSSHHLPPTSAEGWD
jgi:EmrB/QacA subfamily drug resistance transporter